MQHPQQPVRYYITSTDDEQAVVRTVPVAVPEVRPARRSEADEATAIAVEERTARRMRMARLVHAIRRTQGKG